MATRTEDAHGGNGAQPSSEAKAAASRDGALDALETFLSTATTAARTAEQGQPDPVVSVAFALGWQIAELYRVDRRRSAAGTADDDLRGLGRLNETEWTALGVDQLRAGIAKLSKPIEAAKLEVPDVDALSASIADAATRATVIAAFNVKLLSTLTAADFRLGKAYGLGRALADTTRSPEDLKAELAPERVGVLVEWTRDLASALPPHASHAVANSLEAWGMWARSAAIPTAEHAEALRTQGRVWRSLLSGEKRATDVLQSGDYIAAGEELLRRSRTTVRHFLRHYRLLMGFVVALFAGGIAVMLAADDPAAIVTGAAGVLASLGLTWKGAAAALGTTAARIEGPVWGAELDAVICRRITPPFVLGQPVS